MSIVAFIVRIVLSLPLILAGSGVAGAGGHGTMQHSGSSQVAAGMDMPCHEDSAATSAAGHSQHAAVMALEQDCATPQAATDCCQSDQCACACQSPPAPSFLTSPLGAGLSINAMPLLIARVDAATERSLAPLNRPPIR